MGQGKKIAIAGIVAAIAVAAGAAASMSPDGGGGGSNSDAAGPGSPAAPAPAPTAGDGQAAPLSGDVTIGRIGPLTGDWSTHGVENWEGSKFGVAEFNRHLEDMGEPWRLRMLSEDSATNPVVALEKLESLHAKGIGIVVGPETSANIRNIKGYADSNNMVLVSCCSSAPALAIAGDSVFRMVPDDTNQGTAISKLVTEEGIGVLVPVWRGDAWGDGLRDATADAFAARGGQIVEGIRYSPEAVEFSTEVSLLAEKVREQADAHGTDRVAVLFLGFTEVLQFVQSASQHGILADVRWFGPGAITKEPGLVGDPMGLEFSTDVLLTTVQVAASESPANETVQRHMVGVTGKVPNSYVHASYDAVWIVGLSILEAQTTDPRTIRATIPGVASTYGGAIGPAALNEAGDLAQANYEIWGIRDAQWMMLGKYVQETDSLVPAAS